MHKLLLGLSIILCVSVTYADNTCQSTYGPYGPVTCGTGTTASISANGPVTLNRTTVLQGTSINGVLTAMQANLSALTVNGTVSLIQSTVLGRVIINGVLSANGTVFNNTITLSTDSVTFTDCQTQDIMVKSGGDGVTSPQKVILLGKTHVNGDISFADNDGIVTADPDVKITGKIIGGQLIRKDSKNNLAK